MGCQFRIGVCLLALVAASGASQAGLEAGFGKADITPDVDAGPVWLAGFGHGRLASGIHDPLFARAVVLRDGDTRIALVAVDLVGIQLPTVQRIRARLAGYAHVMVASTHNHEGPDVVGLWGATPTMSGVDPKYMALLEDRVVEAVREAEQRARPARAEYGTADGTSLLEDSRRPIAMDGTMRVLRFTEISPGAVDSARPPLGVLVQWNCHPESLGSRNTRVTADFPHYTVEAIERANGCMVAYFSGAIGGLMSNPATWRTAAGKLVGDGTFEYAEAYGKDTAAVAGQALGALAPIELTPMVVHSRPVVIELENTLYKLMRAGGVLDRDAFAWTGDSQKHGEKLPAYTIAGAVAIASEVSYLRLGELDVAAIPGELYPELVTGAFQEPADPAADYPDAPLEPTIDAILPGRKRLIIGLASDEVGYIIPRRQWDNVAPFAYGRKESQYGELNSVGPSAAAAIMNTLRACVNDGR